MKKMIAFFMATICAMVVKYFTQEDFSSFLDFEKMIAVSTQPYGDEYIQSGQDYYTIFTKEEGLAFLEDWEEKDVKGVNLYFNKQLDEAYFSSKVENFQQCSSFCDYQCWQGYYSGYKDFRYINKKKINFQLVKTEEGWIMGFPQILTGF